VFGRPAFSALALMPPRALTLLAALLAVYLIAPFIAGVGEAGLADWSGIDLASLLAAGGVSVASATLATVLVGLGGIPLGLLLARVPGRGMALLGFVVQLPLALPPLASGILLLFLFGYASPIGRLTGGALTDSFIGIVLAEAFVAAPFLIIAARSAFAGIDPVLEDVAATLGHRPWSVFRRVSLALAWRGILAGLLLTWLRAFGEFGATVMLAYHPYSLPVFTYVAFGSEGLPAMLPILLPTVVVAIAVMAASQFAVATPRRRWPDSRRAAVDPVTAQPPRLPSPSPLSLAFRRRLDGFTLDVAWRTDARRLSILGASGSGKSVTLRLIAGLDRADTAMLRLGASDLAALPPEQRAIAYVPQNYGLLPHLPVDRQIRFAVDCDPARARYWTDRLGLAELEHRRPAELSLGQQQRVALARALSRRCSLLLLDEPFSALDAPLRARLRGELLALQHEIDATTILVTHDPAEAILLADDVLLLEDGRVLQSGPVETVFLRPVSEAAARLLGADNVAAGWFSALDGLDLGGMPIVTAGPALRTGPVGWAVRPDSVRVGSGRGVPGSLLDVGETRGGQRRVIVRVGEAVLQAAADPDCPLQPGPCRVTIDPAAVQIWPVGEAVGADVLAGEPSVVA
jgi:ABC-type sulfate/molybdate transport systems ATPase subunit/ABC-type sulfate transport system permease component